MSTSPAATSPERPSPEVFPSQAEIDNSARLPVLALFASGAFWLVVASVFSLISSIKFHSPSFLGDYQWLTYGRVRPAYFSMMLYGFCVPVGLGVTLWMLARLGRCQMPQGWLALVGGKLWNLGVAAGLYGILSGDSTGFENLEFPAYSAALLFAGYILIALSALFTFHARKTKGAFPSQWFLLTALFWFSWVYSTAQLLLTVFPVRGMTQAVIAWWFSGNFLTVWLWLVGLAAFFYFLPVLSGRDLHNRSLALFAYWTILFFGSWTGIPISAPVPAWLPILSLVMTVLLTLPLLAVALISRGTLCSCAGEAGTGQNCGACCSLTKEVEARFFLFGLCAFIVAGLMQVIGATLSVSKVVQFTWFTPARLHLSFYGFFALGMFGAIYYIAPRLLGHKVTPPIARIHFWLAATGILLIVLPLAVGGVLQGIKLQSPNASFLDISKFTLHFLRLSTVGDLLLGVGHLLLFTYILRGLWGFYASKAAALGKEAGLFASGEVRS